ncbi:hypothetical protein SASPL_111258 [Salvia splendens]|uniref:DC1 domain-containing protein n=1 Tax=Salvia splendens TaxID=180675 RepID=A0A8X9A4Z5_SALSN|nr:uncharacterized protein LOC121800392 [Salvia splendens]KAG6427019.1 hypothetical protein SASPL_111258 [Salvia splendens]
MGKIEAEPHITHFSHPHHPLNLKSINISDPNTTKCSACQKPASGLAYSCDSCSYTLHKICSEMPEKLNHKADKKHSLTLLPSPAYSTGTFHCNACGMAGTSFCYHCGECELDLHPACAFTRSSVKGGAHHHPLQLCFEPPYPDKAFVCDVCGRSGSNHWLYRCEECEEYSKSRSVRSQQGVAVASPAAMYDQQCEAWHQLQRYNTAPPVVYAAPSYVQVQQPTRRNDTVHNVVNSVIEGLFEGAANQIGNALIQGAMGN